MSFQITGLAPEQFEPFFALSEAELAQHGAKRVTAKSSPGYPCRVSLAEAEEGDTLILLNYAHLPCNSAYRSAYAIYVREGVEQYHPAPGEIPEILSRRLLAVRGFGADQFIRDGDVVEGADLAPALEKLFANEEVDYVQIYNAKHGCFAAEARRA